jgi:hypothetical protein
LLAEKRQVRDVKVNERSTPCHDFDDTLSVEYTFEPSKIYAIVWDTNRKVYKDPWPFTFELLQSEEWIVAENGTKCSLFEKGPNLLAQVVFSEPVFNVSGIRMTANHSSDAICGLHAIAIETKDNCEEPDSPLYGQHLWNRNDTVATFKCDDKFKLRPLCPVNCVNGKWIGPQPNCRYLVTILYLKLNLI